MHQQLVLNADITWRPPPPPKRGPQLSDYKINVYNQDTKKLRSDSPGLVDFVVGLVEFILHLPDGQVKVFWKIFL